jgi:hypothetical protein
MTTCWAAGGTGPSWPDGILCTVFRAVIVLPRRNRTASDEVPRMGGQWRKTPRWVAGGTGSGWPDGIICTVFRAEIVLHHRLRIA